MSVPQHQLTAEEKLLSSLCRLNFNEEQKSEIRDLMKEVKDWDHFVNLSNEHGIIALCWYNINETGNSNNVPERQLEILHLAYLKNLTRNTFLFNQLEEIISLAKKENIKIVLLKGLYLEKTIYGYKGLRQMNDIDILVRQDKAASLRRILLKNGYKSAPLVSYFHEKIMPAYGKHLPEMIKNGISVEIHFKLFDQSENTLTELFLDKTSESFENNIEYNYPGHQLFFLYLVSHLEKHEMSDSSQLRLYLDLYALLSLFYDEIINEQLFYYAGKVNLLTPLVEKLSLLEIYWDIEIADKFSPFLEKADYDRVKEKFIWSLRHPNENQKENDRDSLFMLLKNVPGINNQLLLVIGHIFPSLAYMKYRYKQENTFRVILYYPIRWFRQIKTIFGHILKT